MCGRHAVHNHYQNNTFCQLFNKAEAHLCRTTKLLQLHIAYSFVPKSYGYSQCMHCTYGYYAWNGEVPEVLTDMQKAGRSGWRHHKVGVEAGKLVRRRPNGHTRGGRHAHAHAESRGLLINDELIADVARRGGQRRRVERIVPIEFPIRHVRQTEPVCRWMHNQNAAAVHTESCGWVSA